MHKIKVNWSRYVPCKNKCVNMSLMYNAYTKSRKSLTLNLRLFMGRNVCWVIKQIFSFQYLESLINTLQFLFLCLFGLCDDVEIKSYQLYTLLIYDVRIFSYSLKTT